MTSENRRCRGKKSLIGLEKTATEVLACGKAKEYKKQKQISGRQFTYEGSRKVISSSTRQHSRQRSRKLAARIDPHDLISTSGKV